MKQSGNTDPVAFRKVPDPVLRAAADVSATVVEVNYGFADGVFAAVSGPRVHGTHGARKCAHLRPRICMQLPA